ncbi:MAG: agmatinase [Gammaproteobacteria bacterium]|nr:agmatinase [Gammaproteobacteria bacterium]
MSQSISVDFDQLIQPSEPYESSTFSRSIHAQSIHLLGFEFDGTACYRKGAKDGPDDIRQQSSGIETYSPYLHEDIDSLSTFIDLGNLPVGQTDNVEENWKQATDFFFAMTEGIQLFKNNVQFLTLGGEHSISYAPIVRYLEQYPNLVLLHLDAHADLRDGYEGYHYSHAAIIRRVVEKMKPTHQLIQYGIRSGTREEFTWMHEHKTRVDSQKHFLDIVQNIADKRPIYLTLDLDYFDPAYLPGTGTPEAGGEDFHSFIRLNKILASKNFVGADVVELAPKIDPTGNSSVLATTVIRELLLSLTMR